MQPITSRYWWIFSIRGGLAILFGCVALLAWPILELGLMESFFGVYIFIQGALTLIAYLKIKEGNRSLPVLLEGVLGLAIGIFLVTKTAVTPSLFIVSFCSWGMGTGLCKAAASVLFYGKQKFYWVLGLLGLLSILFNLMFYLQAELERGRIVWILSIYFVVYGLLMSIFGVKLKAWQD